MIILNLYAGIGGNRKLWGDEHEITAVEYREDIAAVYKDFFPNDKMIIADAHEYLLHNYKEYDFIWSSPPCPTHSRINYAMTRTPDYPDMRLYQEIIFLNQYFNGLWIVENVIPYYEPLIKANAKIDRHLFWNNFKLVNFRPDNKAIIRMQGGYVPFEKIFNINIPIDKKLKDKRQVLRNCVHPETGLHILNCAMGIYEYKKSQFQNELF